MKQSARYIKIVDGSKDDGCDAGQTPADPILALRGVGGALWEGEEADAYVARLREGWSRSKPGVPAHQRVRLPD